MATPSERIWERPDDVVGGPSVTSFLPARARRPATLASAAQRIAAGAPLRAAAADFLDDLRWARNADDIASRIADEPLLVEPRVDAYLAALAEHIAAAHGLRVPEWAGMAGRFLDHFWWPSQTVGLHARAVVESPAAFRRRGIFIGRTTLQRV